RPDLQACVTGCDSDGEVPMVPPVLALTLAAFVAAAPSITQQLTVQLIRRCPSAVLCAPPDVVLEMKRETERIWFRLGIELAWVELLPGRPAAHLTPDLVVLLEEHPNPVVDSSNRLT